MNTDEIRALVQTLSKQRGVDPALIEKIIQAESGWDPTAVSPKGATGLMQLMPQTAADLGVVDATDPRQNLEGGITYLSQLLSQFQDPRTALAAYNFGPGNVAAGKPLPAETTSYVDKILGPPPATVKPRSTIEQITSDPDFHTFSPEAQGRILTRLVGPEDAFKYLHVKHAPPPPTMGAGPALSPEPSTAAEAIERLSQATGVSSILDRLMGKPKSVRPPSPSPTPTVEEQPLNETDAAAILKGLVNTAMTAATPAMGGTSLKTLLPVLGIGSVGAAGGEMGGRALGQAAGIPELGSAVGELLGMLGGGAVGGHIAPEVPKSSASLAEELGNRVLSALSLREAPVAPEVQASRSTAAGRMNLADRGPVRGTVPLAPAPMEAPPPPVPEAERMTLAARGPVRGRVNVPPPEASAPPPPSLVQTPEQLAARPSELVIPPGSKPGEGLRIEDRDQAAKDNLRRIAREILKLDKPEEITPTQSTNEVIDSATPTVYNKDTVGERRLDLGQRKRVADMTPEEKHRALLEDELTGLPNERSWQEEGTRKPAQVMFDVEGLKWTNDNLGHDNGNVLLRTVADAIREEAGTGHRFQGDEFGIEADSKEQAEALAQAVKDRLSQTTVRAVLPDGTVKEYTGFGIHHGVGEHTNAIEARSLADAALNASKTAAVESGARATRGGKPVNLRTVEPNAVPKVAPEGNEVVGPSSTSPPEEVTRPSQATSTETPTTAPVQAAATEGEGPTARIGGETYHKGEVVRSGAHKGKKVLDIEEGGIPILSKAIVAAAEPTAAERAATANRPLSVGQTRRPGGAATETPKYSVQPNELGFFSQLERTASDPKAPAVQKGSDWSRYLSDPKRGVKKDELKWSGLDDYLAERSDKRVSKEEVQDFLRENNVRVQEKVIQGLTPEEDVRFDELNERRKHNVPGEPWPLSSTEEAEYNRLARILEHPSSPKFQQHTEPGGINYREVLLTLPGKKMPVPITKLTTGPYAGQYWVGEERGGLPFSTLQEAQEAQMAMDKYYPEGQDLFTSAHYDEPNLLAHVRLNDRTTPDGKKVLFIEEIQSDWAQKGRREGFAKKATVKEITDARSKLAKTVQDWEMFIKSDVGSKWLEHAQEHGVTLDQPGAPEAQKLGDARQAAESALSLLEYPPGQPGAPFVQKTENWTNLTMKRVLRMAAEEGYDRVAWTTGEQQATRYDLSKHIDSLNWYRDGDTYRVSALKDGGPIIEKGKMTPAELAETVGKDLADKIVTAAQEEQHGAFTGLDLKVGGEGMKGFYDKIVPQVAEKLGKKWGARTHEINVPTGESGSRWQYLNPETGEIRFPGDLPRNAEGWVREPNPAYGKGMDVHSIDITPEMRASVTKEGFPQFSIKSRQKEIKPVTLEAVKANLPASLAQHTLEINGSFHVATPRGHITIEPTGDISLNWHALEEGHGPEAAAEVQAGRRRIVGSIESIGKDSLIKIVNEGALPHEVGHVFLDHFATPRELDVITRSLKNAAEKQGRTVDEVFADGFSDWFQYDRATRENETTLQSLYRRIYEFFAGVYNTFKPTLEGTYRSTARGEAFRRKTLPAPSAGPANALNGSKLTL